jgi:hypothetical protein
MQILILVILRFHTIRNTCCVLCCLHYALSHIVNVHTYNYHI